MSPSETGSGHLDGRQFVAVGATGNGEVDGETVFSYSEDRGVIWATYAGGKVTRGYLVGTRDGNTLDFRYCQLAADGETSTGHCRSLVSVARNGSITIDETWEWESRAGRGTSRLVEVRAVGEVDEPGL